MSIKLEKVQDNAEETKMDKIEETYFSLRAFETRTSDPEDGEKIGLGSLLRRDKKDIENMKEDPVQYLEQNSGTLFTPVEIADDLVDRQKIQKINPKDPDARYEADDLAKEAIKGYANELRKKDDVKPSMIEKAKGSIGRDAYFHLAQGELAQMKQEDYDKFEDYIIRGVANRIEEKLVESNEVDASYEKEKLPEETVKELNEKGYWENEHGEIPQNQRFYAMKE